MKRLVFAALLLVACNRETMAPETTSSAPASAAPPATVSAPQPAVPAAVPPAPAVQGPKLPFVDEASQDPSFAAFREQLLVAVRARDIKAVLALADPNIRTSFGDGGGAAGLERKLGDPELWKQLETILTLGGTFRGEGAEKSFWAPYVYSTFPDSHDAFETLAVIGDNVALRERAAADAPSIATLSRDLVEAQLGERTPWIQAKTSDGRSGFVEAQFLRSPIDYRAGFNRSKAGWRMTALVAGD